MKEGWEIKKLGEVATFQRGLTYSKNDEVEFSNNCVLRSNNIELETMSILLDELKYIREDLVVSEDKKVRKDTILICMSNGSKQHIGKVAFINKEYNYAFGGFMGLIKPNSNISPKFIYYSCISSSYKQFLASVGNGANITNIKFSDLSQYSLPVPPIAEQEKIVAELDCLSGIIEKKKQQLKEYDALAQSIFYEMFGDPVENEKGWVLKKVSEVAKISGGYAFKSNLFNEIGIPVLRIGNINTGRLKTDSIVFYQEDSALTKYLVYPGDLVMSLTGTVGKDDYGNVCVLDDTYPKYYLNQRNAKFILSENIQVDYLKYFLKDTQIKAKLTGANRGVRQGNISNKDIEGLIVPIPHFSLQQEFASKIEAIEKQKELIKKSIEDVETLFNSKMEYYFN